VWVSFALAGCAVAPPAQTTRVAAKSTLSPPPSETTKTASVPAPARAPVAAAPKPIAPESLALLRVEAGALVTQVNGDPKLRCMQADCTIPLPPGKHRFTVGYKRTEMRAGSTVTFASMYPREIELTLEPGHRYRVSASGRYAHKWWVSIADDTANKVVYDDRP
jgi:hypothetical protein